MPTRSSDAIDPIVERFRALVQDLSDLKAAAQW
jgi:hypothetical protein